MGDSRLILEDYQILHELGTGSYGSAHLALHVPSNTKHVIKKIKISHMTHKEVENARREVQVLSSLSHPYITQFQGSCEEDGFLLIAMDYCAGGDLNSLITKRNGILFPEDRILDWFVQLCLAVKYVHDRKILHRDIKSQNIFLTDDGKVRLGDFGIAKILNSSSELAKTCIGTPYYLSPEMCENKPYNNKSDVWALGCVLYEMVTLRHAFEASNMKALILKIIKGTYPPVPPRYSRDLRLLLSQIFQREPQARPSICAVLRKAFIFKRVSKFISGCEEVELKQSLVQRKYHLPTSSHRVLVSRRPSDITEPGAKYGVSLNRKLAHRSPSKPAKRTAKQAIPSGRKTPKVPVQVTEKLKRDSRKRCPSEDILSSKDPHLPEAELSKRYQRRSKSIPHAFKQNNRKPQHQHNESIPSPIKVNLMLDSAGLRKGKEGERIDKSFGVDSKCYSKESDALRRSPGWLADEFMTKKVKAAHDKRKHMEVSVSPIECAKETFGVEGAVAKGVSPCKDGVFASKETNSVPNIMSKGNKNHEVCIPRERLGVEIELPTSKDVKELANQSLKWQGNPHSGEDDHDEEEALLGVSPEQLRQGMHEKMKDLVKERTKKMTQMVSERRQWAYETEKSCNTSVQQNNEGKITKSNDMTHSSTDGDGEQKHDKLHSISKWKNNTDILNNSHAQKSDEWPQEACISRASDKNHVSVMKDCDLYEAGRNEVTRSATEERALNVVDCQESTSLVSNSKCNELSSHSEKINVEKILDHEENYTANTTAQQKVKKEDRIVESDIPELMPQGSHSKGKEPVASETLVKLQHSTPSMRARWGAVHTADLEKSPLETTASEMDTTGSSDCVVVYREAGERKQWRKECGDVLNVLSEAQIIEESRKVQSEIVEVTKSLTDVENLSESFLEQQCMPIIMNSTFTLKEGLEDCKGASCECFTQANSPENVKKSSYILNNTFQIEKSSFEKEMKSTFHIGKSSFEKEMKSIGPPLLNSTLEMKLHCDQVTLPEVSALNSTYIIDKKKLIVTDTIFQGCHEENPKPITDTGTVILDESKQNPQGTYTVSLRESENNAQKTDQSWIMREEKAIINKKIMSEEVSTKTKSGLLEKLRLHMSPQLKNKYHKWDKLPKSPLSSKVKGCAISASSETDIPKVMDSLVPIKTGGIKHGLSSILRKFSSKHIKKVPARSRSEETMEKDLESLSDSNRVHSDPDSPQQGVECVTVKFISGAYFQNGNQKIRELTNNSENRRNEVSSIAPRLDDKSGVLGQDICDKDNNFKMASIRGDAFNATTGEMYDKKTESSYCTEETEHFVDEGTTSDPSSCAFSYLKKLDEMSTDSGIASQKIGVCQISDTDCTNSQLLCCASHELQSESDNSELLKVHNGDHDSLPVSNSSEITSSSGFIERSLENQKKALNFSQKLTSCIQNCEMTKTTLLSGNSKDMIKDISPVSTSGIEIKLMTSSQHKDKKVQSKCKNYCLDFIEVDQMEHRTVTTAGEDGKQKLEGNQNSQSSEIKIATNEVLSSQCKLEGSSQSISEQSVTALSAARVRPTVLDIGVKATDYLQSSQDFTSREDRLRGRRFNISRVTAVEKLQQQSCSGSVESVTASAQSRVCGNLFTEPTSCPKNVKPQAKELFSSSDEESEDLAQLRQSMELLLNHEEKKRRENKRQLPELWHLDQDGGVVPGGGGVYSWIEEQRARLEDELSLDVFKKAYHLLEEAQEREGCVVGESVSQVECLLGPGQCHLAYDILQLVVAEAVYHN